MKKLWILFLFVMVGCAGIRPRYHTVAPGETLPTLAKAYDVPLNALRERNSGLLSHGLRPGAKLYIPFEDNPLWNDPDNVGGGDRGPASDGEPLAYDLENAHFSWPVPGPISSFFGSRKRHGRRRQHEGIDIVAGRATPVHASRSGHVIYADNKISGYGKMIIVRHADSFTTVYAHLSEYGAKKGQFVSRGQVIGRVGRTGRATNYHLHFEVRTDKRPVDPLLYLERRIARN